MKTKSAYATALSSKETPQSQAIPGRETEMKKNNAGGVTFTITPFQMLERFLILGSENPSYYASAKKMTADNATNVRACLQLDGKRTVDMIVEISDSGRAPKNDPALFALAVAATPAYSSPEVALYALSQLSKVARIGTHLFHFAEYLDGMRGWGRSVKSAVGEWYTSKSVDQLAYQLAKYQQRDGWSTKDMLSLAHVKTNDARKSAVMAWAGFGGLDGLKNAAETWTRSPKAKYVMTEAEISSRRARYQNAYDILTGNMVTDVKTVKLISAYEAAKKATTTAQVVNAIVDGGLSHEMIPTQFKSKPEVWEALLVKMPLTAMVRNLGTMSKVGLLKPLSAASKLVMSRLNDQVVIDKSRIHPLQVLLAQGTYSQGHGLRSDATWTVVPTIVDALEEAFYMAFGNATPTGKNTYIGLDVSGSMSWASSMIRGTNITSAMMGAAMMLLFARIEKNYANYAFSDGMRNIGITAKDTLETAMKKAANVSGGGTDCSLPMLHAKKESLDVDAFIVITDNETWRGSVQPSQALKAYRNHSQKHDARLIVMGMVANEFTIADPKDPYSLDVVGFDSNVPALVTDFIRGSSAGIAEETED